MRTFKVRIEPEGHEFDCASDQALLLAGLAAGLRLPWSCRNGTCRSCLSWLVEGRIEHRIEWPGLSSEEKAEGLILPCVAEPRSDLVISPFQAARS